MSEMIKDKLLQPGNYTIGITGFTRIGSASKESGFDSSNEIFAKDLDTDEILFDVGNDICFTLKNNDTNEEQTVNAMYDCDEGILFKDIEETEKDDSDDEMYLEGELRPEQIIASDGIDEIYVETDGYYFEEVCPEGIIEKSFKITEPLDLSKTSFSLYEDEFIDRSLLKIEFPVIGQIKKVISKGNNVKHLYFIEGMAETDVSEIRKYLEGSEASESSVLFSDSYDGFIISDGVLTAYKGYSNNIVIPKYVSEIADNVFLFPVESITMWNKNIKVGKNFPWDKVL